MIDITGKIITMIGAGKSGQAAARLALQAQAKIKISENAPLEKVPLTFRHWVEKNKIPFEVNRHTKEFVSESDLLIISPGVRFDAEPLKWARQLNIPIWSEIELAYRFCECPMIAVTGSNGKTTVSTLIRDVLVQAGKRTQLCGNVGNPFSLYVSHSKALDYIVLEVSSFQLETIVDFKPRIAVFLNFSQNHLDRHKNLEEYFHAKKKIFLNQDKNDFAILNADDEQVKSLAPQMKAQVSFFHSRNVKNPNFSAVLATAEILGIPSDICHEVLNDFKGIEHRLEKVCTLHGVDYMNDSKATTAVAVRWALERLEQPILWICGGRDKNIDFSIVKDVAGQKVKKMFVIGEAKEKIMKTFDGLVVSVACSSLDEAVQLAHNCAETGDCVLLSPMCASFDMFANFEERGKVFKRIIRSLS